MKLNDINKDSGTLTLSGTIRTNYDYILVDCPPSLGLLTVNGLVAADEVIVPDVYRARDTGDPLGQAGSAELALRICRAGGRAQYLPTLASVVETLMPHLAEGDLVLTMGAGDVWKVADELVERLCGSNRVRCAARAQDVVSPGGTCPVSVPAAQC